MLYDKDAEVCKQCTLKHLSTAFTALDADTLSPLLRRVYFCGNLSHAANHFVKLSEELAEEIRALRIDAQDDGLNFIMPEQDIKSRLTHIIERVSAYTPEVAPVEAIPTVLPVASATRGPARNGVAKRGCPCHANK